MENQPLDFFEEEKDYSYFKKEANRQFHLFLKYNITIVAMPIILGVFIDISISLSILFFSVLFGLVFVFLFLLLKLTKSLSVLRIYKNVCYAITFLCSLLAFIAIIISF